jgi:hypothetical protein
VDHARERSAFFDLDLCVEAEIQNLGGGIRVVVTAYWVSVNV